MVDFTSAQIEEVSQSPVTVQAPVENRGDAQLIQSLGNIFEGVTDNLAKQRAKKAESEKNKFFTSFVQEMNTIAQGVDTGKLSRARGKAESRILLNKYLDANPEFGEDLLSIQNKFVSSGLGSVVKTGSKAEQELDSERKAAMDAGYLPSFVPRGSEEEATLLSEYRSAELRSTLIQNEVEALTLDAKRLDISEKQRKAKQDFLKQRSQSALFQIAADQVTPVKNRIVNIVSAETDLGRVQQQLKTLRREVQIQMVNMSGGGVVPKDVVEFAGSPILGLIDDALSATSYEELNKNLQGQIDLAVNQAELNRMADPRAVQLAADVKLFSPQLMSTRPNYYLDFLDIMSQNSNEAGAPSSLQAHDGQRKGAIDDYLSTIKNAWGAVNKKEPTANPQLSDVHADGIMKGMSEDLNRSPNLTTNKDAIKFLNSVEGKEYLKTHEGNVTEKQNIVKSLAGQLETQVLPDINNDIRGLANKFDILPGAVKFTVDDSGRVRFTLDVDPDVAVRVPSKSLRHSPFAKEVLDLEDELNNKYQKVLQDTFGAISTLEKTDIKTTVEKYGLPLFGTGQVEEEIETVDLGLDKPKQDSEKVVGVPTQSRKDLVIKSLEETGSSVDQLAPGELDRVAAMSDFELANFLTRTLGVKEEDLPDELKDSIKQTLRIEVLGE